MASNPIVKEAQRLGWEISKGSKHYKLYHPLTGQTTILPYGFKRSSRADIRIKKQLVVNIASPLGP